jgi:hypothetical protein
LIRLVINGCEDDELKINNTKMEIIQETDKNNLNSSIKTK